MGRLPELHHPGLADRLDQRHQVGEVLVRGLDGAHRHGVPGKPVDLLGLLGKRGERDEEQGETGPGFHGEGL